MQRDEPVLLTVGIPVYNGEKSISDLIKSINVPIEFQNKVEILVSDNCSTDNTEKIIKEFPFVKYYKNQENIGYDRNMDNIFQKASGKFVWTIGADDVIIGQSVLQKLLNLIINYPDLALINVVGQSEFQTDHKVYKDETFLSSSNFTSGFISANIIKRSVWIDANPSNYFGSGWIHFGVVIAIANRCTSIVTREKFVDENPRFSKDAKNWDSQGSSLVVMLKLVKIFCQMPTLGYSRQMTRKAKYLIKSNYPKQIIKAKAQGLKINSDVVREFISNYKEFFSFWLIDLPALFFPKYVCHVIYSQRKKITGDKDAI